MNFLSTPIIEIAAVVMGLAGPLLILGRELLNSDWLSFIWKKRTVAVAFAREGLLFGIVAAVFVGQLWILDLVLDQTTLSSLFTNSLRSITTISAIVISVGFLLRIVFLGMKHFQRIKSSEESPRSARKTGEI